MNKIGILSNLTKEQLSQTQDTESISQYEKCGIDYQRGQEDFYAGKEDPTRIYFEKILSEVVKGKIVADIGCGAGTELLQYASMGAAKVIGVEPSETMRHMACHAIEESDFPIEVIAGEIESIPLSDTSVDVVTARYALHIIKDFKSAFPEVARVLKPGGIFIAAVAHPTFDERMVARQGKKVGERIELKLYGGKSVVYNYTHTMDEYIGKDSELYFICDATYEYAMSNDDSKLTDLIVVYKKK